MLQVSLAVERLLSIFAPGALLAIGSWYLHRPFLLRYFPSAASDELSVEGKTLLFVVVAFCAGSILSAFADIAVAVVIDGGPSSTVREPLLRRIARTVARTFSFRPAPDPRVEAMRRYDTSNRRAPFHDLLADWTWTSTEDLANAGAAAVAHQHLVVRLRVANDTARRALESAHADVMFTASLFASFVALLPVGLLAFGSGRLTASSFQRLPDSVLGAVCILIYVLAVATCYALKRRFCQFCHHIVTLALHAHDSAQGDRALSRTT